MSNQRDEYMQAYTKGGLPVILISGDCVDCRSQLMDLMGNTELRLCVACRLFVE